ncbi:MAG: 50S ribosomal protein L3 N(5)-glutamine methyltransferase [Hyphomicrobiaceae bacterium]
MPDSATPLAELISVRDWLRYAVSRFNAAGLAYGHGTESALDEAAFLILSALHLDVSELEPWLDARLTTPERRRILDLVEARIFTRKPAPYLVGAAYIRGRRFKADERAIVPRSFLAELICDRLDEGQDHFPPFPVETPVLRILDLCTGGGSLAILCALAFPEATVDAVDISAAALALARENVTAYDLEERIRLVEGDLFAPLGDERYDLIVSNPPYVTDASISAFPPEYRAEPDLAHRGGADGLDLVRRIIAAAGRHLHPTGQVVIEIGQAAAALVEAFPGQPFVWLETATSSHEVVALPASALESNGRPPRSRRPGRRS